MLLFGPNMNASNMFKNRNRSNEVKNRLARIGVLDNMGQEGEDIYFDCCIRQNLVRVRQEQSAGLKNKNVGSSEDGRAVKRRRDSQGTYGPGPQGTSQQETEPSTIAQTPLPEFSWSLVFTAIN